jgi:long-chain fatty acid transport protein
MNKIFNRYTLAALVAGMCLAGNAFATNGYFTQGTGTKNKSMAGSGIALPEDSIDIANNPAVSPFIGDQLVIGAALFSPVRKYNTTESQANGGCSQMGCAFTIGPNSLKSDSEYFVIPHIAKSWQLNNDAAWALVFYGRGGMNTDWKGGSATFDPTNGQSGPGTFPGTYGNGIFGGDGTAGVNLSQAFLDINWAKKFSPHFTFGVSLILAAQMFEAEGVQTFAGYTKTAAETGDLSQVTSLSNNGTDWSWGYGLKLGMHIPFNEKVALGVMYQTKIKMDEFSDYSDLFADNGGFDIPANFKIGLTVHANDNVALNFDIEHTWFSDVGAVGNPIQNLFSCPTLNPQGNVENCLGGSNGGGFGWDDMTIYKLGLRWKAGEDWTWRFGYSYGEQPIGEDQMTFNILAPAVIEQHFTTGFTLERTPGRQFNMSFMYAPNEKQTGPNNFDPSQMVTWEMYQWEIEASYSWRF